MSCSRHHCGVFASSLWRVRVIIMAARTRCCVREMRRRLWEGRLWEGGRWWEDPTRPNKAPQGSTGPNKAQGPTRPTAPNVNVVFASSLWRCCVREMIRRLWGGSCGREIVCGRAGLNKAPQGSTRPNKAQQGPTRPNKAQQGSTRLNKAQQGPTRPDKAQQGPARPIKTQQGAVARCRRRQPRARDRRGRAPARCRWRQLLGSCGGYFLHRLLFEMQ